VLLGLAAHGVEPLLAEVLMRLVVDTNLRVAALPAATARPTVEDAAVGADVDLSVQTVVVVAVVEAEIEELQARPKARQPPQLLQHPAEATRRMGTPLSWLLHRVGRIVSPTGQAVDRTPGSEHQAQAYSELVGWT
jgi:hypothetical protein